MKNEQPNLVCFSSIVLSNPIISAETTQSNVTLNMVNGGTNRFTLSLKYGYNLNKTHLPLLRMAFCMPLLNYGLFSKKIKLNFPISESDLNILNKMNFVFSRDIFVNKILRRRANYILPEFIPNENTVKPENANPKALIESVEVVPDHRLTKEIDNNKCGILSSGGKESLLTYGILKEIGVDIYPLYINESGSHWRTALPAYRYHKKKNHNTQRVWTNVDRFYNFMLDNLFFIRANHRNIRADTYPIRLCIFPFYVFALLPIFIDKKIGNLLIGSEFDDQRSIPIYKSITHYYGVYDQHQDYDKLMNNWYSRRIPGLYQWSAMRNISGLIVERILVSRYPHLAKYQRSCHSCHFKNSEIVPCGTCSKCQGVLLFLLANDADPKIMNYRQEDISCFKKIGNFSSLRLDQDERDYSFFLIRDKGNYPQRQEVNHVDQIHVNNITCNPKLIPKQFREKLLNIIEKNTAGYCKLEKGTWVPYEKITITS